MDNNSNKGSNLKFIFSVILAIFVLFVFFFSTSKLSNSVDFYTIENGEISYEEPTEAIIIRDETLLSEEGFPNGFTSIASEGERVGKNSNVIRCYTSTEDEKLKQISDIDNQINKAVEESGINVLSSDIVNIEAKIEQFEKLSPETWQQLSTWGKSSRKLSLLERKKLDHAYALAKGDKKLPFNIISDVMDIYKKSHDLGYAAQASILFDTEQSQ